MIRVQGLRKRFGAQEVLRGVDLDIATGEIMIVIGRSGGGKSVLLKHLIGLLRPTHGQITVDGAEITDDRIGAWRLAVGYVPQESFLLHDTVRANLGWAQPGATDDQMWMALERAAAAAFLRARQGLDTVVGDRGLQLSGGERQRLALARALLRNPRCSCSTRRRARSIRSTSSRSFRPSTASAKASPPSS